MPELLLAESSYQRLAERLKELAGISFVTLNQDGVLRRDGIEIETGDLRLSMVRLDMELIFCDQARVIGLMNDTRHFEFIQTAIAGLDNPLFKALVEKTDVFCKSDAQAPSIAEFVVASVLNRWHRFDIRRENQRQHAWQENHFRQIMGSHWLIIGYGNIGRWVARQVKGFGARVTGVRRNLAPDEYTDKMINMDQLQQFLPNADVVLLSCALNDATRGLVDETFLQSMNSDAVLVNIGRGELLDEDVLVSALDQAELDYAILDVFENEPLPETSPLWDNERIQITPHASHRGSMTDTRFDELFLHNLNAYLSAGKLRNQVTPDFFKPGEAS
jgi:phosphoglycerate dehydrogenase-like enzyme